MQPKSARTLRGLSIAIIIISILAIIGSLVMFATAGLLTYAATDPDAAASVSMSVEASPEASAQLDELGMTVEDGLMLTAFSASLAPSCASSATSSRWLRASWARRVRRTSKRWAPRRCG